MENSQQPTFNIEHPTPGKKVDTTRMNANPEAANPAKSFVGFSQIEHWMLGVEC